MASSDDIYNIQKGGVQTLGQLVLAEQALATAIYSSQAATTLVAAITQVASAILTTFPRLVGTFTLAASSTTNVAFTAVVANSVIIPFQTNASAATLQGSAAAIYMASHTAGVGFAVKTANGSAAAGTEQFSFIATNPA